MGRKYDGVRAVSENSIEIDFRYQGVRCRERIKLQPTTTNLKKAYNHRCAILDAIDSGTFVYSETFPNSKKADTFKTNCEISIKHFLDSWLKAKKPTVSSSTWDGYRKIVNNILIPVFGQLKLNELKRTHIKAWVAAQSFSNKRLKNILSPLRNALSEAVDDEIIEKNILDGWKYQIKETVKEKIVDPFSPDEMELILNSFYGQDKNIFQFAFWTGLRPSEYVALQWQDIDFVNGTVEVNKGFTEAAKAFETPKTLSSIRRVKLLTPALEALQKQKQYTFLADKEIFHNPRTDKPWTGHQVLAKRWGVALKKCGVRYRKPYQTRHTYASMMLSAGELPMWVANQMGHSDWTMIARVYGKWIPDADPNAGDKAIEIFGKKADQKLTIPSQK